METETVRQYMVAATDEADVEAITRIGRFLAADGSRTMRFVAPNGERVDIPQPLYEALLQLTAALAQDEALTLMSRPLHMGVTIDEASHLLNASPQYVVERLDEGVIPSTGEGARRCISLRDVMVHKARLRALQREGLKELVPFAGNGSARSVSVSRSHHARCSVPNMRRNFQLAVLVRLSQEYGLYD